MADRYLIENREAAIGVQMLHMRQRWGAAVWQLKTQVLLGRLKYALPGWEEAPESLTPCSYGVLQRTRRRRRVAGRTPVGLATVGGLAEIAAGVMGTAATWVASTGAGVAVWDSCAQTQHLAGACGGQARGWGGGASRGADVFHLITRRSWSFIFIDVTSPPAARGLGKQPRGRCPCLC
jgi:hypothetical protein